MELALSKSFRIFCVCGFNITSNFPLDPWLSTIVGPAHLEIEGYETHGKLFIPESSPIVESGLPAKIFRTLDGLYFYIPNLAGFLISQKKIQVQIIQGSNLVIVITHLLSTALSLWMEQQGIRVLHSAAFVYREKTVLFMADSTIGKSTLTASFLQIGAKLLSDDIVPIAETPKGFFAKPGYPAIRISNKQKEYFIPDQKIKTYQFPGFGKLLLPINNENWGEFCNEPKKIDRVYLLDRVSNSSAAKISLVALTKPESLLAFIRYSFTTRSPTPLGTATQRMAFFGRLVEQVNVTQLTYPSGYEYLPGIVDAIRQDLGL